MSQGQLWPDAVTRDTLAEARRTVQQGLRMGVVCPCCDKWCKVYRRTIHAEVAEFLVELVRRHQDTRDWVSARDIRGGVKASTDAAYLVHWGLVRKKDAQERGPRGGLYRPTELGVSFVHGLERVPAWVELYNNRPVNWASERVDVAGALGRPFEYATTVNPPAP